MAGGQTGGFHTSLRCDKVFAVCLRGLSLLERVKTLLQAFPGGTPTLTSTLGRCPTATTNRRHSTNLLYRATRIHQEATFRNSCGIWPGRTADMSQADFLGRAIEQVKKAIETDTAGDYEAAYQQYYSAREWQHL